MTRRVGSKLRPDRTLQFGDGWAHVTRILWSRRQSTVTACTRKRCTCLFIYSCQSSLFKCWPGRHPVFCMPAKFQVIFHPTQANLMWDTTPALFPLISTCSHPVLPSSIVRDHIVHLTASSANAVADASRQKSDINQLNSTRGLWWSNDSYDIYLFTV